MNFINQTFWALRAYDRSMKTTITLLVLLNATISFAKPSIEVISMTQGDCWNKNFYSLTTTQLKNFGMQMSGYGSDYYLEIDIKEVNTGCNVNVDIKNNHTGVHYFLRKKGVKPEQLTNAVLKLIPLPKIIKSKTR